MSRANTVEEHRGVEDDGVDASELLEHHEHEGDDQLGAVLGLEQVPHGVGGKVADAGSLSHVSQLLLNVGGTPDASQNLHRQRNSTLAIGSTCRHDMSI